MADIENSTELNSGMTTDINENFNTIKTLLNSIRAQGVLNTSDVDRLLTGINTKLEKINTEEDIDLIKVFLSELKQNLDERHGVLLSKFGAIESLFSNLLKNSGELPKSAEIKELFDIVATNLTVFSKEVVTQKETLDNIALRLEAMRSDDSDKKDIIKNITLLKPDLERLSNGFDSIVISLNDNFKTIIKTITSIDKTEYLDKFSGTLSNIEMSSNTVLSALQMLDKKTEQLDDSLKNVLSKEDITSTNQKIFELTAQSEEIATSVSDLSEKYQRVETLADKIDASVNIIASLKTFLEDTDDKNTQLVLDELKILEEGINKINSDSKFDEFKTSLESILKNLTEGSETLSTNLNASNEEIKNIVSMINALDINVNFKELKTTITDAETNVKSSISEAAEKINTLNDANITRVLNDISSSADSLNNRINKTQTEISALCEKSFGSVLVNISELKNVVSQIDENSVSANNAIFSSITDRLSAYENMLKSSLDNQEYSISNSSSKLVEKVEEIKNVSNVLEYKMDSSVVEVGNVKKEFEELKSAVQDVLALDFVTTVKDLRVDLYASKQEITTALETSTTDVSEKVTKDLYDKYELIIKKFDIVEDELKKAQASALAEIRPILDNISSSIIDTLTYISEIKSGNDDAIDTKIDDVARTVKEANMSYVESVRDIVNVIKVQVDESLKKFDEENSSNFEKLIISTTENTNEIKNDIKYSYSKLLEIQDLYNELKQSVGSSNENTNDKFEGILSATGDLKSDFESKLSGFKIALLDKVSEFKQDVSKQSKSDIENLTTSVNSLNKTNIDAIKSVIDELGTQINELSAESTKTRANALAKILDNFVAIKDFSTSLNDKYAETVTQKVNELTENFNSVKAILNKVDENVDGDMTRQLSIIESNFETLVSQITILFEKTNNSMSEKINEEFSDVSDKMQEILTEKLETYKYKIEESFDNLQQKAQAQTDYLQDRISNLNTVLKSIWDEQTEDNLKEIEKISEKLQGILDEKLEISQNDYIALKERLNVLVEDISGENKRLTQDLKLQLDEIVQYINSVLDVQAQDMSGFQNDIKTTIDNRAEELRNIALEGKQQLAEVENSVSEKLGAIRAQHAELSANQTGTIEKYAEEIKQQLEYQAQAVETGKNAITQALKQELKIISGDIEKETDAVIAEVIEQFDIIKTSNADDIIALSTKMEDIVSSQIYDNIEDLKAYLDIKTDDSAIIEKLDNLKNTLVSSFENLVLNVDKMLDSGVFNSAMADFRVANELLVNSAIDNMNDKIESFVNENLKTIAGVLTADTQKVEEKLSLFDKKFVDTITDKFEEIKIISNKTDNSFEEIKRFIGDIISDFEGVKDTLSDKIDTLTSTIEVTSEQTNKELRNLNDCFENLRSQISSKSFDEAFQSSINKQISNLEDLVNEQLGYIEDINDLCGANLPDVAELNSMVKGSVISSLDKITDKLDSQNIEDNIKQAKTEIITQILNVFNQISFAAEQEEILDFIQEKHDELINVLSRIVSSTDKINTIKNDIALINDKINSIISAEGDVDYIYSLQDLESDIANLRVILNEMKEHAESQEFEELVSSTNDIYNLVESIKTDLPTRQDFNEMAEDIVSISSRTNKLLLSSDESYKMLQDNLQDFKLVIDDIDERTKNFAKESGMDRIDSKLNALNTMMVNGSKTNQVFNQVFEYLAEWVDNAGSQINAIADKVVSLEDIGQIKDMLVGLKSDAEDNSTNDEMVEALGTVFDKQNKKMAAMEKKLDKLIVDNNVIKNNSQLDISPVEDTLNKFLVSMEEKFAAQQDKISSLEAKLGSVMKYIDEKATTQLSKKVGGMDRQIAKLNKSIEKIASHVAEK